METVIFFKKTLVFKLIFFFQIYPSENGQSVIPAEKLQKEIAKGKIQPDDPNAEKELDGDMDERLDKSIREVWTYYDPKGTGIMKKDAIKKFFKV